MGSINRPALTKRAVTKHDTAQLRELLSSTKATLLEPSDEAYPASIARWSMAASKPAGLVVLPTTADDVSIALKYASEHNIDVAVKGGGHSTAGASSTDGGLLFDLGSMRKVAIEDRRGSHSKVFRIQGGASWGDVDNEGVKHGLHTVGGTVADTGVGGLTLGGGYGWLSGTLGLTIDNLVEATVVVADGTVITADEAHHPELFWALGGAGQNFGVATEFVLKAWPQGDIWAGMVLFPPDPVVVEKVVNTVNDAYTINPSTGKTKFAGQSMGGLGYSSPPRAGGKTLLFVAVIWNGDEASGKAAWKDLFDLEPLLSTMATVPYPVANSMMAPPVGNRSSMKGACFAMPLRPAFVIDVMQEYTKFVEESPAERGVSLCMFELYDPTEVAARTAGSFANRGTHLNALIAPIWTTADQDTQCRQWSRDINEKFKTELRRAGHPTSAGGEGGVGIRGRKGAVLLYGNYDQYDEKPRDIFGENYLRLQKTKARYDPHNVFDKLFAIRPEA